MRRSWRHVARIAASWLIGAALLASAATHAHAQEIRPPQLVIVAPPELDAAAARIRRVEPQRVTAVMARLGLVDGGSPITVLLVPETSPVARDTPPWVAGFAQGASSVIVILPARTPSYPYDSMDALLLHEVIHVLISRAAPRADVPRWFHEGIAMALEDSWSLRDRSELAMAVVGGQRSLAAIDAEFHGSAASAARAYGVAGAFVRDLLARYGPGFPPRLIHALAAGASFDHAFAAASSSSLAEAERLFWRESWWFVALPFATSSAVVWMVIVLLAVSARRRTLARRRELRRRWDAEDATPPIVDDAASQEPRAPVDALIGAPPPHDGGTGR